jgi:predicted ATPase
MDAERWAALKTSFEELLELPHEQRSERLATLASTDPTLSEQLIRLLTADAGASRLLRLIESPASPAVAAVGSDAPGAAASAASPAAAAETAAAGRDPFGLEGRTVSHFQVQQVLGSGGMGVVYRAEDLRLGRTVALKFLLPQYTLDPLAKERFLLEARTASGLDHPHVCTIHEAGETEQGQLFLAMSHYAGETLRERLAREGALPVAEAIELTRQICSGLGAAHAAGIVHRDLKPGNLMLTAGGVLKILDFGLAKVRDLSLTGSGMRPGTVAYMSPEQLQSETVDERSDLWSLGVVLYEMLTGRTPFGAGHELSTVYRILHEEPASPSTLRPEVVPELEEIVLRLLRKAPEERYLGAAEMLTALSPLEALLEGQAAEVRLALPPVRSCGARCHNLPVQPTSLIGREAELAEIRRMLRRNEVRLLTLTGPAGTGKTRLALQAAADLIADCEDGVFFVNLAPLVDSALVASTIAQVLGLRESGNRPPQAVLCDYLQDKQMLLVLDNFEQIVEAAPTVAELLAAAPDLWVLVTSRTPLNLRSEHEYSVPPLTLPDLQRLPALEELRQNEAVQLFTVRAQAARADFSVTNDNAVQVAEICHRLDGLPLAIELAAARIRILPPQAMLTRLQSRLSWLTGGARDLPERHQTLRDAIAWSYELLGEAEKVLFERLSVFSGGRTLEAIEAVCGTADGPGTGSGPPLAGELLDMIASLVDESLLRAEVDSSGEPRFLMLETIQEFAAEKLQKRGEAEWLRRRHAEYFLALAEAAEPQLMGPGQGLWLGRLAAEHDNLRAALSWMARADPDRAARLAGALWRFWNKLGLYREGRGWLGEVLAAPGLPPAVRAKALLGAAVLANFQNDAAAEPLLKEGLALARSAGDRRLVAACFQGLGHAARIRGDLPHATSLFEQALVEQRQLGDRRGTSVALCNLGSIAQVQGDLAQAETLSAESLALAREVGDISLAAFALHTLSHVACEQGDLVRAGVQLRESLLSAREAVDLRILVFNIAYLALVAGASGAWDRAARLAGVAEAQFAALGTQMNPPVREQYERRLAAIRTRSDGTLWQEEWKGGVGMTLEEAIAFALEEHAPTAKG